MWVKPSDKAEFLQGRPEPDPYLPASTAGSTASAPPRRAAPARTCTATTARTPGYARNSARPRDSGDPIDASDWLSKEPPPEYRSTWNVDGWEIPGDVVAARLTLDSALQHLGAFADALPAAADIAAGRADITRAERERWLTAQEECRRLAAALATHPSSRSAHDPFSARRAVFAAARTAQAVKPTNSSQLP